MATNTVGSEMSWNTSRSRLVVLVVGEWIRGPVSEEEGGKTRQRVTEESVLARQRTRRHTVSVKGTARYECILFCPTEGP